MSDSVDEHKIFTYPRFPTFSIFPIPRYCSQRAASTYPASGRFLNFSSFPRSKSIFLGNLFLPEFFDFDSLFYIPLNYYHLRQFSTIDNTNAGTANPPQSPLLYFFLYSQIPNPRLRETWGHPPIPCFFSDPIPLFSAVRLLALAPAPAPTLLADGWQGSHVTSRHVRSRLVSRRF